MGTQAAGLLFKAAALQGSGDLDLKNNLKESGVRLIEV